MTRTDQIRKFSNSADARAAGFSGIEWLRAFTFEEHMERIRKERSLIEGEYHLVQCGGRE